jgi:hypothetical protein
MVDKYNIIRFVAIVFFVIWIIITGCLLSPILEPDSILSYLYAISILVSGFWILYEGLNKCFFKNEI